MIAAWPSSTSPKQMPRDLATNAHRTMRRVFLDELTLALPIYPYTMPVAEIAGRIDAEQRILGLHIPFPDLLIGATALHLGYAVLNTNVRHFRLIPNLKVIPF